MVVLLSGADVAHPGKQRPPGIDAEVVLPLQVVVQVLQAGTAVSYTRLDVYKRQHLDDTARPMKWVSQEL